MLVTVFWSSSRLSFFARSSTSKLLVAANHLTALRNFNSLLISPLYLTASSSLSFPASHNILLMTNMSNPLPSMPPGRPTAAIPVDSSSGLWDRLSSWVAENKAVVYTIAGVAVVVTGAGAVYYLNSDSVCSVT